MESHCLKCKKKKPKKTPPENIDQKISSTSNSRAMILSKCAISGSKKSRFCKKTRSKRIIK